MKSGTRVTREMAIILATWVSLSGCSAAIGSGDTRLSPATPEMPTTAGSATSNVPTTPRHRKAGLGKDYEWGKDHIFVKLSNAETGGVLTLIQDNLKSGFNLGMHLHQTHTEIFYILDGEIEFTIGQQNYVATRGSAIYIPAGMPHAAKSSKGGKMLMFYAPGGFDEMLAEIENASWFERLNPFASARRDKKYDVHKVSAKTKVAYSGPKPRYQAPGAGDTVDQPSGRRTTKFSSAETDRLATMIEETLKPGAIREPARPNQAEIIYVLDGSVEFNSANKMLAAQAGDTIFYPPGLASKLRSADGAKILVYRTPGAAS